MKRGMLVAAAAVASVLSACGSAGTSESGSLPASSPGGATLGRPTASPVKAARDGAVLIPIGVQPVQNTPVDVLPAHVGHDPIVQSPPQPLDSVPPAPTPVRIWVVSPSGNDGAAGTDAAPLRTISKAVAVAGPGELIRVLRGTYAEKVIIGPGAKDGRPDARIVIQGEGKPKLVPTSEGTGGMVQFERPHWVLDGFDLDVQGQAQFAVTFEGNTSGSMLTNNEIHGGALGAGVTTYGNATGAVIENNHIHHFSRGSSDSHGVVIQPTSKNITVRNNDIHDNSGDSVQCLGPEGFSTLPPADGVTIESNHFYANRENGVDIKTCKNVVIRNNRMHKFRMSSSSKGEAIVIHMSASNVLVENNDLSDAGKGIAVGGNRQGPMPAKIVLRKNKIHDILTEGGMDGSGIRIENAEAPLVVNNTLTRLKGTALVVGGGTGGATNAAVVRNNIFDAPLLVHLGALAPGLKVENNLLKAGGVFTEYVDGVETTRDLSWWRGRGYDVASPVVDAPLASPDTLVPAAPAVDKGTPDSGSTFCGTAPDLGAVETGC